MAGDESQRSWCIKVLGIDPAPSSAGPRPTGSVMAFWRDAKEAVDEQLAALGRALRSRGDPDFDQIAQYGLFGLTGGGQTVALMAALQGYEAAPPADRPAAAAAVGKAVAAYRGMLQSSRLADALEDNVLRVPVNLRGTMDGAFRQILTAIR